MNIGHAGSNPEVWDAAADGYDDERKADPVYAACLAEVVRDLRPHGRVLDAGCGTGLQTALIGGDCEIHCVDFSRRSLAVLKRRLPEASTAAADIRALPFADESFDAVLCANALQHLNAEGHARAAGELLRVLKRGGRFAVSVHHYSVQKQRAGWIKEGKPGQAGIDYIYRFSKAEFVRLFPGSRIRAVGFYGWPKQQQVSRVAGRALAAFGHGHMLIASGTRL